MSFLSVQDLLSVIRVCRRLRASVCEASSLWTHVDAIDKPSTLRFVLERTRSLPVSVTGLYIDQIGDDLLQVVVLHMWHVRALGIYLHAPGHVDQPIPEGTNAYTLFTSPAPLLQRISFSRAPPRPAGDIIQLDPYINTPHVCPAQQFFGGVVPLLKALLVHEIRLSSPFRDCFRQNSRSLQALTMKVKEGEEYPDASIWNLALYFKYTTFNIELTSWWRVVEAYDTPCLRRINIHWTKSGPFVPDEVIPLHKRWQILHIVHVTHVCAIPHGLANVTGTASVSIPPTCSSYSAVQVRSCITSDPRLNVRALDMEGRERIFCGLQPATVTGLFSRIPADRLSIITVTTAAVAVDVLSNAQLPALHCIRLVSNTSEMGWISIFARDILSATALERIELSVEGNPKAVGWTTSAVRRVLASCVAAGCALEKVVFLGFQPEARCVSLAATFAEEIIVDQNWREPLEERIWFTQPSFEWM